MLRVFWDIVTSFWCLWVFLAVAGYIAYRRQVALAASGIDDIDKMDGRTFEKYLATLFQRLTYSVELTPYAGDWGGDLVLKKGTIKTVVQAKRWHKNVGVRAVQEAVAAKAKYGCTEAMVVTNSGYTNQARELARVNRVELWDRERLVQAILSVQKQSPAAVSHETASLAMAPLTALSAATEPTCILCHKPVSEKVARFCQTNPVRFGGSIYCFEHQKQVLPPR